MTVHPWPQDIDNRYTDREFARVVSLCWDHEARHPVNTAFCYNNPIRGDIRTEPYGYEIWVDSRKVREWFPVLRLFEERRLGAEIAQRRKDSFDYAWEDLHG